MGEKKKDTKAATMMKGESGEWTVSFGAEERWLVGQGSATGEPEDERPF